MRTVRKFPNVVSMSIHHPDLLAEITAFCERHALSKSAFGKAAVGDPCIVFDLENGRELRRPTEARVRQYLDSTPQESGAA